MAVSEEEPLHPATLGMWISWCLMLRVSGSKIRLSLNGITSRPGHARFGALKNPLPSHLQMQNDQLAQLQQWQNLQALQALQSQAAAVAPNLGEPPAADCRPPSSRRLLEQGRMGGQRGGDSKLADGEGGGF